MFRNKMPGLVASPGRKRTMSGAITADSRPDTKDSFYELTR